ncbi:MAG: diguanylate cyclase domain-containing protein [Limnochordia bacterium]|jgi:diguanylate cyclase (GGDEF)-like protein/PAS domain S-box-containing protein
MPTVDIPIPLLAFLLIIILLAFAYWRRKKGLPSFNYRELAESISDPFMAVDENSQFIYWNQAAEIIFGISSESVIGKSIYEVFPQIRGTKFEERFLGVLSSKEPAACVTTGEIKGVELALELSFYPLARGVSIMAKELPPNRDGEFRQHDPLTGLFNRNYCKTLINKLDEEDQLPLSLLIGGVNGLRLINDSFGYHVGDQILQRLATILKDISGEQDVVGRWGGDEFIILLPRTDLTKATELCQRIYALIEDVDDLKVPPSISFGIATKEKISQSIHHTIRTAETLMYRRKLVDKRSSKNAFIETLMETIGIQGYPREKNPWRIQELAMTLGEALELSYDQLDALSLLAALHDIGAQAMADNFLGQVAKLSPEEWQDIYRGSCQYVASLPELQPISAAIEAHHEHWDGSGSPQGLKGREIPLLARIISIIEAYDVMTYGRRDKEPIGHHEAMAQLKRCAGQRFDPYLVDVFISLMEEDSSDQPT